jgi:glycosyltransferase involved in cell wall biosynthesis
MIRKMQARISAVIPTYNYARFIGETLGSVFGQTLVPDEIVIVDDGSTDDTEAVLREFGDQIRYVRQANGGVCAARNRGVAEASHELIAFLDADDILEPTYLEKMSSRYYQDDEIELVHCGVRLFDSDTGETISFDLEGGEDGVDVNLLLWESPHFPAPGIVLVSRKAFDAVGGFDVRQKVGEDWDFCYRVARKYKIGFVPEALINYRIHDRAAHHNVDDMESGMGLFYKKAFDTDDVEILALKKRAMGSFHKVMAGSYFQVGRMGKFAEHTVKSLVNRPANLVYFLKYPLRRLK